MSCTAGSVSSTNWTRATLLITDCDNLFEAASTPDSQPTRIALMAQLFQRLSLMPSMYCALVTYEPINSIKLIPPVVDLLQQPPCLDHFRLALSERVA